MARERGFSIAEDLAKAEVERVHGFYARRRDRYLGALQNPVAAGQADPFGNFTVHAGYWLWGLAAEEVPPDETTSIATRMLASKQSEDGHWTFEDTARAPMQASDFMTTALAAFALKHYGAKDDSEQTSRRITRAQQWLLESKPQTTDDLAFRLFGLQWTGASLKARREPADQLRSQQRAGGGWAQQDNMPEDAYATGLALAALRQAGDVPTTDLAFGEGIRYLLKTQQPDGSWFVKTRAIPTNPYFESGFPHGKSQFISYAATCWATMALLQALPPVRRGP